MKIVLFDWLIDCVQVAKAESTQTSSKLQHQTIPEESSSDLARQSDRPQLAKQMSEVSISDVKPVFSKQFSHPLLGGDKQFSSPLLGTKRTRDSMISVRLVNTTVCVFPLFYLVFPPRDGFGGVPRRLRNPLGSTGGSWNPLWIWSWRIFKMLLLSNEVAPTFFTFSQKILLFSSFSTWLL